MKKLILLLTTGAFVMSASAQTADKSLVFDTRNSTSNTQAKHQQFISNGQLSPSQIAASRNTKNKGTAITERWYNFLEAAQIREGNIDLRTAARTNVFPIWFDSTVLVNYLGGPSPINYSSVYQLIDPINTTGILNDVGAYQGEMQILPTNTYKVDTIYFRASYIANVNRPGTIIDTLILTVAPAVNASYRLPRSAYPKISDYVPAATPTIDTLRAFTQLNVDSVGKTIFSDITTSPRITWKEPITIADRDTESNGLITIKYFQFAVPNGGLTIPAGASFGFAYTFKSGDVVMNPNVDSVDLYHRFYSVASEKADGVKMPYYYYDNFPSTTPGERSMPSLMFSTSPDRYLPSVFIELINTHAFDKEFIDMGAHVTCATCTATVGGQVGVKNITFGTVGNAYPNPATGDLNIPFTISEAAAINVSIANTVGQVVATQNMGKFASNQKGEAKFNVSNFSNGVYFYTVEANGQRITKRFVVAH